MIMCVFIIAVNKICNRSRDLPFPALYPAKGTTCALSERSFRHVPGVAGGIQGQRGRDDAVAVRPTHGEPWHIMSPKWVGAGMPTGDTMVVQFAAVERESNMPGITVIEATNRKPVL